MDNDTILGRLLDLGDNNGTLISVCLVESSQFLKWIIACDIGVEDKKGAVILAENLFSEFEGTSSAQRLGLNREGDGDTKFFLILFPGRKLACNPAGVAAQAMVGDDTIWAVSRVGGERNGLDKPPSGVPP